jgi:hypothetical protein
MNQNLADQIALETAKLMKVGIVAVSHYQPMDDSGPLTPGLVDLKTPIPKIGGAVFEYRAIICGQLCRTEEIPLLDTDCEGRTINQLAASLAIVFSQRLRRTLDHKHATMSEVKTPPSTPIIRGQH